MTISPEFRKYALARHKDASGSQNAQMSVEFWKPKGIDDYESAHWYGSHEFISGKHTEERLIEDFWAYYFKLNLGVSPKPLLRHVQLYTRFNPCPDCTKRLVTFKADLAARMQFVQTTAFDVADRGNTYLPKEGVKQISVGEGIFRKEGASSDLRMVGWTYESINMSGAVVKTGWTLGTKADPIVIM